MFFMPRPNGFICLAVVMANIVLVALGLEEIMLVLSAIVAAILLVGVLFGNSE